MTRATPFEISVDRVLVGAYVLIGVTVALINTNLRERALASTLAENTARVLRQLRPRRFPESEMDPVNYKLLNPEPFLR